jgi:hypothetical protein
VAAVLPTALAAFTTARNCSAKSYDTSVDEESKEQFLKLVDLLLSDMKLFKQVEMIKNFISLSLTLLTSVLVFSLSFIKLVFASRAIQQDATLG